LHVNMKKITSILDLIKYAANNQIVELEYYIFSIV
jgi:hypothetical protein